jgi:ribose transport system permease protein
MKKKGSFWNNNKSLILVSLGCIILWLLMGAFSQSGVSVAALINNAYTASFLSIAGLAQMLVVTTGRGAIDLSIPGMITLGGYLGMWVANGQNSMVFPAFLVVIAAGIVVGFLNSLMVIYLKIPAIIATMAMNYIIVTITMLIDHQFNVFNIAPALKTFVTFRVAGIPIIIFVVILLALLLRFLLKSTTYGKSLLAMGQNLEAARLAGVQVVKVEMLTYIFAAALAGIAGMLISARVSGARLGMGDSYQMESIACIVVGGTLMSGGQANAIGTLIGSLFLYLIIAAMQLMGANAGLQSAVKGALIIAVLLLGAGGAVSGSGRKSRKARTAASSQ